ncbi:MAG: ATP-binding protein [Planctomycetota bacterium]
MNLEISSLMWGLTIGFAAGSLIVALLWHLIHKHRVREVLELGAIIRSNLENLFTDQPLRTIRRRRLRDADPIAVVIDEQLLILRDQNADTRRQVKQLRIVLESMTEGVVAVDSRLRVILANPAAQPLLGIEASSLGRLLPEVIRNPKLLQIASDSVDQCKAIEAQFPLSTRDSLGRTVTRLIAVRIAPILRSLEGERPVSKPMASGAVFVVQDVTELRRLERMRQDFVTNASHELKTPLASIKLYSESLLDWALTDQDHSREFVQRIEEQADRLTNLVSDMLSLSRLESGQELFRHSPMVIEPLLRARVASYRDKAVMKNVGLELELHKLPDQLKVLAADEAIRQILDNLIDNAVKYTPAGGRVEVHAGLYSNELLEIFVTDTGMGIPRSDLSRIFERFYRVDKARSRDLGGTGLGLAIVKHIVSSLGGEVGVESREGIGSRFRFTLPVVVENPKPQAPETSDLNKTKP